MNIEKCTTLLHEDAGVRGVKLASGWRLHRQPYAQETYIGTVAVRLTRMGASRADLRTPETRSDRTGPRQNRRESKVIGVEADGRGPATIVNVNM